MNRFIRAFKKAVSLSAIIIVPSAYATLVTYPEPTGFPANNTYTVQVREFGGIWQNLFVYNIKVGVKPYSDATTGVDVNSSMVNFSFSNTVEMRVTLNSGTIQSSEIRPSSFGIIPVQSGNELKFNITQNDTFPRKFVLRVNNNWDSQCLHVIANPLEINPPSKSEVTHYFGPGVYTEAQTAALSSLKTGDKVYIAGGAVLAGHIMGVGENQSNISITGRGIIHSSYSVRMGSVVFFRSCSDIRIDGITGINDARVWAVRFVGCEKVVLSNIALFGHLFTADGIHFDDTKNSIATGCFVRSTDDLMLNNAVSTNNVFKNSVVWGDKAHCLVVGYSPSGSVGVSRNHLFQNIDVLNARSFDPYMGVIKIWPYRDLIVHDVVFNNIRIDPLQNPQTEVKVFEIRTDVPASEGPVGKAVRNITIRNLSYAGSGELASVIRGSNSSLTVDSVQFINYRRQGKLVTSASEGNISIGAYANNVRFLGSSKKSPRTIKSSHKSGQGESNVQIVNLRGQVVQSAKVVGNRQLGIDNLAPGVYQVLTQTEKGITCEKMVR